MVLDPLVGHDAADEEDVDQAVAEDLFERRTRRRAGDPLGVDRDRQHAGRREPERLELLAVEVGVAEREVDPAGQRRQLLRPSAASRNRPGS